MVKCICINDLNKPKKIPKEKWVKKGSEYTVIFTTLALPQKELAFDLEEIELGQSCFPYEYFLASRFSFTAEELNKLKDLIQECNQISLSMNDLLKQTNILT